MRHLFKLLSVSADAKTKKGEKQGWLTGILYLAPANESEVINVCPHASPGCRAACLYTAGMGKFPRVKQARLLRTIWFKNDRTSFIEALKKDILMLHAIGTAQGMRVCVRLNGTSDIPWENLGVIEEFPNVRFYDYTKSIKRMLPGSKAQKLKNYHLTFSRSETNGKDCELLAKVKKNIAVVFKTDVFPETYLGLPVVNGDLNDLRFLDKKGVVVGLKAKGRAKKDTSGFVVAA